MDAWENEERRLHAFWKHTWAKGPAFSQPGATPRENDDADTSPRPNGSTIRRIIGPLGRGSKPSYPIPTQGVALGWENRHSFGVSAIIILTVGLLLPGIFVPTLSAQLPPLPPTSYYYGFAAFYAGDYKEALKRFQRELPHAITAAQTQRIDSICFETMVGECYYKTGAFDQALEHYTAALQLFLLYPNWMLRVDFQPIVPAAPGARKTVPWGVTARNAKLGEFPRTVLMSQGEVITKERVLQGGALHPLEKIRVAPHEIVRCTALAIRRRAELLGPMSKHDPLTAQLLNTLLGAVGPPNHWSEAWVDLLRGLAYIAAGRPDQSRTYLERSLLAGGEYDHPLTSYALLELGRLDLQSGNYAAALKNFLEATYAAVNFLQYDRGNNSGVLEEAFRLAVVAYLAGGNTEVFPPLTAALGWVKPKDFRSFRATLLMMAAENFAVAGRGPQATAALDEARSTLGRLGLSQSPAGARFHAALALALFQQRKIAEGEAALTTALASMQRNSLWLLHIGLADRYYVQSGGQSSASRIASDVFAEVLRDPLPVDWAVDPLECMTVLMSHHPLSFDHWFEAAVQRKDYDSALEIADRARRRRFFASLPWGGRLESLRWIFEAPAEMLDPPALLVRQDLRNRCPEYTKLSDQSRKLRDSLAQGPLAPADADAEKKLAAGLKVLDDLDARRESMLPALALRREPAPWVFPPLRPTADIRKALPEGHAALVFFAASGRMYAMLLNRENYTFWEVAPLAAVRQQIQSWLRDLGQYQANSEIAIKDLANPKWKTSGAKLLELLLRGTRNVDFSDSALKELVIVPDGIMWYLPFEALQVSVDGRPQSLVSRFRIRYAPTFSLATPVYPPLRKANPQTAVILGKLSPRADDALLQKAFEQLQDSAPGVTAWKPPLPGPAPVYGALFDRLIVLDDLAPNEQDPLGWLLWPMERGRTAGALRQWLRLPWGGPREILLPGFHTLAEEGLNLKRLGRGLPGNEVFLTVCGLMADDARTILLSRWRTGGQSSFDLIREFAQELPHADPAGAWQRAVLLEAETPLNPGAEPRLKKSGPEDAPRGDHPFFWAGYLLIDSGRVPQAAPPQQAPALK